MLFSEELSDGQGGCITTMAIILLIDTQIEIELEIENEWDLFLLFLVGLFVFWCDNYTLKPKWIYNSRDSVLIERLHLLFAGKYVTI